MTKTQKQRIDRLLPKGQPKHVRCYDNKGETADRYTVVFTGRFKGRDGYCFYLHMSEAPCSPQGVGIMASSREIIDRPISSHLGRRIQFKALPEACQRLVKADYREFWGLV